MTRLAELWRRPRTGQSEEPSPGEGPSPRAERRRLLPDTVAARLAPRREWWAHLPVALAALAYAYRFAHLGIDVLHGYGQPAFDMGIPDQGIWLLSRFHNPFVTVMGRQLFGDHSTYIYLLVVPLYWIYPHTAVLLVLQAVLLGAAAIPIYALGRHLLGRADLASALAVAYLLNPALQQGNMEQFHVECFEVFFLALAVWSAVDWRPRVFIVSVALLLACKEDAAMYALPLAAWVFWRRDRRVASILAGASVGVAILDNELMIPAFIGTGNLHSSRLPFGGLGGSIREAIRHPAQLWSYLTSDQRPRYLWQMAFAAGLVFLASPEIAAIGVIGLAVNVISTFGYQHQINYHYSMPIVPLLACGSVWAVSRLRRPRYQAGASGIVLLAALWSCILWGLAPFSDEQYPHLSPSDPQVLATNQIVAAVPAGGAVSAWYGYVPQLDHRTQIYMWPNPFHASYWGTLREEGRRLPEASQVRYVILPTSVASSDPVWASVSADFHTVTANAAAALYERNS